MLSFSSSWTNLGICQVLWEGANIFLVLASSSATQRMCYNTEFMDVFSIVTIVIHILQTVSCIRNKCFIKTFNKKWILWVNTERNVIYSIEKIYINKSITIYTECIFVIWPLTCKCDVLSKHCEYKSIAIL